MENLNGRLRLKPETDGARKIPDRIERILQYKKLSKVAESAGKSPLELLIGQKHKKFYDIVCRG